MALLLNSLKEEEYNAKKQDLNKMICHYCNASGHIHTKYYKLKHEQEEWGGNDDDSDNLMVAVLGNKNREEDLVFTAWHSAYVNSSATEHMLNDTSIELKGRVLMNIPFEVAWFKSWRWKARESQNWDFLMEQRPYIWAVFCLCPRLLTIRSSILVCVMMAKQYCSQGGCIV